MFISILDAAVNSRLSAINCRTARRDLSLMLAFFEERNSRASIQESFPHTHTYTKPGDLKIDSFEGEICFLASRTTCSALIALSSIANRAQLITDCRWLSNPSDSF